MSPKKDHSVQDECDKRHCTLRYLEKVVEFQGKILWFILFTALTGLIKIFFGG